MRPEAIESWGSAASVCKQEPEAKDRLGKNIEDGISHDLGIHAPLAGTISNTPDNWIESPEDEGEGTNGGKEVSGGAVLARRSTASWNDELVHNDEVSSAGHGIVSPLGTLSGTEGGKETEENHEHISDYGDEDVGTIQASEEGQIEEKEWGGDTPVDVPSPEDLAVDMLNGIWGMLVDLLDNDVGEGGTVAGGHGEVGDGSKGGDESRQDVEETFLLI